VLGFGERGLLKHIFGTNPYRRIDSTSPECALVFFSGLFDCSVKPAHEDAGASGSGIELSDATHDDATLKPVSLKLH
jgi:hypothetical protein